jgi:hypothetical protein
VPRRTWTDDDLRTAVADAASWSEVIRALGLADSGEVRGQLRVAARQLDLDVTEIELRRGRRWSDAQLREAVAASRNLHGVFLALGLRVGGGAWSRMQEHIVRLGLDTSHWTSTPSAAPAAGSTMADPGDERSGTPEWIDEEVRTAADGARSVADVMRRLGLDPRRKRGRRAVERPCGSAGSIRGASLVRHGQRVGERRGHVGPWMRSWSAGPASPRRISDVASSRRGCSPRDVRPVSASGGWAVRSPSSWTTSTAIAATTSCGT